MTYTNGQWWAMWAETFDPNKMKPGGPLLKSVYSIETPTGLDDYLGCGYAACLVDAYDEVVRICYRSFYHDELSYMKAVERMRTKHKGINTRVRYGMCSRHQLCVLRVDGLPVTWDEEDFESYPRLPWVQAGY